MEYTDFKEELSSELTEVLSDRGYDVDISDVTSHKANQNLDGITIRLDGANISPTLYTESAFDTFKEGNLTLREMAEKLADTTEAAYKDYDRIGFNPADFNKEYIQDHSYLALVNTEMNQDLLSRVPHEEVPGTDLSAYAKVQVGDGAFITITNDHAYQMNATGSEILDAAKENTLNQEFKVQSMDEALKELMGQDMPYEMFPSEMTPPLTVISTANMGPDGANALLSTETLDKACEKMGCDSAIIIPSSRHELLAVNGESLGLESTADIKEMVETVNMTEVLPEDKLSDNIYEYDATTKELTMCNEQGLFEEKAISNDIAMDSSNSLGMGM